LYNVVEISFGLQYPVQRRGESTRILFPNDLFIRRGDAFFGRLGTGERGVLRISYRVSERQTVPDTKYAIREMLSQKAVGAFFQQLVSLVALSF
jgi:hypothetical protein